CEGGEPTPHRPRGPSHDQRPEEARPGEPDQIRHQGQERRRSERDAVVEAAVGEKQRLAARLAEAERRYRQTREAVEQVASSVTQTRGAYGRPGVPGVAVPPQLLGDRALTRAIARPFRSSALGGRRRVRRHPRNSWQISSQAWVVSASDSTSTRSSLPWKRPAIASAVRAREQRPKP